MTNSKKLYNMIHNANNVNTLRVIWAVMATEYKKITGNSANSLKWVAESAETHPAVWTEQLRSELAVKCETAEKWQTIVGGILARITEG